MDAQWWTQYLDDVLCTFQGSRYTTNAVRHVTRVRIKTYGNSGAAAISLAASGGSKRIILLGYDCQHTGGKRHWHADYPAKMGNADRVKDWHKKFAALAKAVDCEVINASRETALVCFPRMDLEAALADKNMRVEVGKRVQRAARPVAG